MIEKLCVIHKVTHKVIHKVTHNVCQFFPVSCHLGPKGPNGKIVLIRFVHVHKKYKTRVGDRQRKSGYCGIFIAQKVSVRTRALIMLLYQI